MPRKSKHKAPGRKRRATTKTVAAAAPAPPIADRITEAVAALWSPPVPVDPNEFFASQVQYYFGLTPAETRDATRQLYDIIRNEEAKDRDRIEAAKGLAEWKRVELAIWSKSVDAKIQSQQKPQVELVPDEELAKGLRLLLEMEPTKVEHDEAAQAVDDDLILPLEGVG